MLVGPQRVARFAALDQCAEGVVLLGDQPTYGLVENQADRIIMGVVTARDFAREAGQACGQRAVPVNQRIFQQAFVKCHPDGRPTSHGS